MIASKENVTGVLKAGCECVLHQRHLESQTLQPSQRTFRFVQIVNTLLHHRGKGFIRRSYHFI